MVAYGTATPTKPDDVYHGQEILAGYARVSVEEVSNDWKTPELNILGGEGERNLDEAIHSYILWDKRYIIIKASEQASRPASPQRAPSMSPPSPQAAPQHSPAPLSPGQTSTPASLSSPGSPPSPPPNKQKQASWSQASFKESPKKQRKPKEKKNKEAPKLP